jgi:cardiolipin synthase
MDRGDGTSGSRRVLTLPNAISLVRIAMIPVFVSLITDPDTTTMGIVVFSLVIATDWVDGLVARRTGQISELGKVLDPVADRLAIATGMIALVVRGVFPLWAAVLILARDVAVIIVGAYILWKTDARPPVRWIGKVGTFSLMVAVPAISWAALGLPLSAAATVIGWSAFLVGIVEYYLAAIAYATDARSALRGAA